MASAKPVTSPLGSAVRVSETMAATPEVPIDRDTSPGPSVTPSAAAMLSPVPAASTAPAAVRPMTAFGAAATCGSSRSWPSACSTRAWSQAPVRVEK